MLAVQIFTKLSLILILLSGICSVLAITENTSAGGLQLRAAKSKTRAKAPPPAKPKVNSKAKAKTPKPKPATPKAKPAVAGKAKPKTTVPAKASPTKTSPTKLPPKTGDGKSCPLPKKEKRDLAFETVEEIDTYYGIGKREMNRAVTIRGRSIEKWTNVCGFHELRDQPFAEARCQAALPNLSFVLDITGNLVKVQQGATPIRPPDVACDHIIELQLVADVMERKQICAAAERMLKAAGFIPGRTPNLTLKMKELIDEFVVPAVN
ncbi:hypothetical protein AAF712_016759, partial [Marasmius tenuissimus]